MASLTTDALRAGLARLDAALVGAIRTADAGLGPAADLPALFARHPDALGPDAIDLARELSGDAAMRPLAAWTVALHGRRAGAAAEARARAWRASAVVRTPGGAVVPFVEVDGVLAATDDRSSRLALDAARAALAHEGYAALLRERWARERDAVEALAMADGYVATWERLTGVDVRAVVDCAVAIGRETAGAWDDVLAEVARRRLGAPPRELPGGLARADEPLLLADPALDTLLPAGAALAAVRTQVAAMGLDPAAGGRLRADVGTRAGQRPGAWCAAVQVPGEVYVTVRPRAGVAAWREVLDAVGCALHAAHVNPDAPAELRHAGDVAVRAAVGRLLAGLAADDGWLRRYADLDRPRAARVRRHAGFIALRALRRDAAALRLAVAVLDGTVPTGEATDAGIALAGEATGAQVAPGDVVRHAAPWLGALVRVRAAVLAAQLAGIVRERFDEDWWRNPRCGPWLAQEVCAPGNVRPAVLGEGLAADAPVDAAADARRVARAAEAALV